MKTLFSELDLRKFTLFTSYHYKVELFQIDLLRIYNLLLSVNSFNLAKKIKRIIFLQDYNDKTMTDFDRPLKKASVERYVLSPKHYLLLRLNQEKIDKHMELYYEQKNNAVSSKSRK